MMFTKSIQLEDIDNFRLFETTFGKLDFGDYFTVNVCKLNNLMDIYRDLRMKVPGPDGETGEMHLPTKSFSWVSYDDIFQIKVYKFAKVKKSLLSDINIGRKFLLCNTEFIKVNNECLIVNPTNLIGVKELEKYCTIVKFDLPLSTEVEVYE